MTGVIGGFGEWRKCEREEKRIKVDQMERYLGLGLQDLKHYWHPHAASMSPFRG